MDVVGPADGWPEIQAGRRSQALAAPWLRCVRWIVCGRFITNRSARASKDHHCIFGLQTSSHSPGPRCVRWILTILADSDHGLPNACENEHAALCCAQGASAQVQALKRSELPHAPSPACELRLFTRNFEHAPAKTRQVRECCLLVLLQ